MTVGGVTTVSVGGVPTYGPMQAIGGTRGANVYPWEVIDSIVTKFREGAAALPDVAPKEGLTKEVLDSFPPPLANLSYAYEGRNKVNVVDILRPGSDVATQFAFQPADCRLFYTKEMILDRTKLWLAAAKVGSGDLSMCVKGSTNQKGRGSDVYTTSPGFNNSFEAAVKGRWLGNETWGLNNSVGTNGTNSTWNYAGAPNGQSSAAINLQALWSSLFGTFVATVLACLSM